MRDNTLYFVDIDTGGTMTDTLVSGAGRPLLIKVESTPHDITLSFRQSLEAAAAQSGFESLQEFLNQVRHIRWSSTLTSNVLAERKGPKLGLVVSEGHEKDLYASDPADTEKVIPSLVQAENIIGLPENAGQADIMAILKYLMDKGIRRVNICLRDAFPDGRREQEVLTVIDQQFPDHFLGSVPALAGSEMLMRPDNMSRTFAALINAYVHNALANTLFKAEDELKLEYNWKGDLLVGHLNGGVGRIGKTKAVDTIESGPLFGAYASAHVAREQQLKKVVAIDIGGTTGKCSAVSHGSVEKLPEGHLFGIPVRMPMPALRSSALGGGSVAGVVDGVVKLGPESMGAAPGPACYDLGGSKATLTDALVILGAILPDKFLNGTRRLNIEAAHRAIEKNLAGAMGASVVAAAQKVFECAVGKMAELIRATLAEVDWDNNDDTVLFAFGGNGPMFATFIADSLDIREVRVFALGNIFSAYGSAIADVLHVYERALVDGSKSLGASGHQLYQQARRDLRGEGFNPDQARYTWQIDTANGAGGSAEGDVDTMLGALGRREDAQLLRLEARFALPRIKITDMEKTGTPEHVEKRASVLGTDGEITVFLHDELYGHQVQGPCIVDGGSFTWLIGNGWQLDVDLRGDGIAKRSN
ncbi:MAG: hydantoinase/oxoprolinase family protein [Gammaproteobacteria bacterium]|nr:hydantoinase/oxoprolinase family protein [Gammaproteobacteria bacterium]